MRFFSLPAALLVIGCRTSALPTDGAVDTATHATPACALSDAGAHEYVYLLDQLTIEADSTNAPHNGFNLDGLFSGVNDANGCLHQDYLSLYDQDQNCTAVATRNPGACRGLTACSATTPDRVGGVDNQLPTIATTLLFIDGSLDARGFTTAAVQNNQLALLLDVSNITDPCDRNASDVRVRLFIGIPMFSADCGEVAPNRMYAVSAASLIPGGATLDDAQFDCPHSSIVNGRLIVAPPCSSPTFTLPLPIFGAHPTEFLVHAFQLRGNVSPTQLTNAMLGGWVEGAAALAAGLNASADSSFDAATVSSVLAVLVEGLVDIDRPTVGTGGCVDTSVIPAQYGGISIGLGLHGIPAQLAPTPLPEPVPGACGSPAVDAGMDAGD